MLKNYLKIAWRNLYKRKAFSLIHILGLTIGITVCMMIFLYIMNEFSVDRFHKNGDHIYRVMRKFDDKKPPVPYLSGPYAPALLNDFPSDITMAVRVRPDNYLVSFDNKAFSERKVYVADSTFFSLFSYALIKGNAADVLKKPESIVLTETTAKKYFGSVDNAMGKVVQLDKHLTLKVTGICKNVPSNSHLDFDMVIPMSNIEHASWFNGWINNSMFVYVQLNPHTDVPRLEGKFAAF